MHDRPKPMTQRYVLYCIKEIASGFLTTEKVTELCDRNGKLPKNHLIYIIVHMSILHIIMKTLLLVLLKSIRYYIFYRAFNITLDFPVFSNWAIFPWNLSLNILLLRNLMLGFQFNHL